uniref:Tetratricopeptide repeat-containing protein n=1 Tax=Trepomonas sp. PC1 TaxID=1076344 RepID=A0A146K9T6_9EUKA|eukprot:JAP92714.1 hypothetical protein TPC1_15246 [Trepomonas sp. PC1]
MPKKPNNKKLHHPPSQKAIQGMKLNMQQQYSQINKLLEQGDVDAAYQMAITACNQHASVDLLDLCYEIFSNSNDQLNAVRALQLGLQLDPHSPAAITRYVTLFQLQGEVENLNQALKIINKQPTSPQLLEQKCFCLSYMSQYFIQVEQNSEKALGFAQQAAELDQIQGGVQLAACYMVNEQLEESKQISEQVFQKFIQFNLIKHENDVYEPHINEHVPDCQTLINYIRTLNELELFDEAEAICQLALQMDENDPVALHELAWIKNLQEEYQESLEILYKVRAIYVEQGFGDEDEVIIDVNQKIKQFEEQIE